MKNKKSKTNDYGDILKNIKSTMVDVIVRQWLNTPIKEWRNKTPLQMIKAGRGFELLSAILTAEKELKDERDQINGNKQNDIEEVVGPTESLYADII